jgi:hypothetical protein
MHTLYIHHPLPIMQVANRLYTFGGASSLSTLAAHDQARYICLPVRLRRAVCRPVCISVRPYLISACHLSVPWSVYVCPSFSLSEALN